METRELRYFVAVAEELHFGRAAERLGIAQPPLSRAIGQLERRLGARLLERTSRSVALTGAGEVLLAEARTALDAVAAAERRTRRAAEAPTGGAGLVLVSKAGAANELVAKLLDQYAAEPDAVGVDVMLVGPGLQEQALRDGRADVAILHAPWDDVAGFDTEVLTVEDPAVLVQAGHPLTGRDAVHASELEALVGLPAPRWPDREGRYADGPGPEVHDVTQLLQLIALGRTYLVAPVSAAAQAGEGVAAVPLLGAPPVTTLLAWPPQSRSRDLASFVRVATGA
ncbi:LysR family transcriptional regulator [uncultured Nocardioides sp.]|uniref:LysR family transcriptional regulator n=1 Tax=uncultured Nocardioides sp. TaxID=198441 RepID=UPI0026382F66|nr:LysR family transcriptional regulator [uncultured Nocardioides sp.]